MMLIILLSDYIPTLDPSFGFIFFSLVGLVIEFISFYHLFKAQKSNKWKTTKGKILSSDIIDSVVDDTRNRLMIVSKPKIKYLYIVENKTYTSDKIMIFFIDVGKTKELNRKYQKDTSVTVFYDPDRPSNAVLEPGIKNDLIVFMILGILALVIGFYFEIIYLN